MNDRKLLGAAGEALAAALLYGQGYEILEQNYRCRIGEIDLICQKDDTLVFVEVKSRFSVDFGRPCEAVNPVKQERMRRVADYYQMIRHLEGMDIRFQVIEILVNQIQDAF